MVADHLKVLMQALFEGSTEAIIICNSKAEIGLINPAAEKLFEYSSTALVGKKIECLIPSRFASLHKASRENFMQSPRARGMGVDMNLAGLKKSGAEFPVEVSLSPIKSGAELFIIAFVIDITARKMAEQKLKQSQHELEQMTRTLQANNEALEAKVEARTKVLSEALHELEQSQGELQRAYAREKELNALKSRFLSMASHEFRTPLTTILSSASIIDEYNLSEQHDKREKHVARIKSAVENLNDILSDFLSLARIEEGKVIPEHQKFNLYNLVHETQNEMQLLLKNGQTLQVIYNGMHEILSDKKLIRNILINILSNAMKFSYDGKPIELNVAVSISNLEICVHDYGMGISENDMEHLFERFFRGENVTAIQGTGLGLSIVASYVSMLQGEIKVKSKLYEGSTFTINIPI